jgi:hypothetical protein
MSEWNLSDTPDQWILTNAQTELCLQKRGRFVNYAEHNQIICYSGDLLFGQYSLFKLDDGFRIALNSVSGQIKTSLDRLIGQALWDRMHIFCREA